ncbi:D-2-hydroxyacid dehydrogenase family protein [Vibrio furnissii]|uniref:D-2-hydroxyacid dehydrogenase family protein n=1 Tax=Vibrio furnissii TaxID=29494 RepID=UPI00163D53DD|nr:D-2-hydroxyacid dehydrogenase family protein [Vibrio furnissii]
MKIAILDDYQDVVRELKTFQQLAGYEVTVFNHTFESEEALALALAPFDAVVLIRERTVITESLLARCPNLKLISQTGKVSNHIDVALCHRYNVEVAEGVGSPTAPAELCWSLIMAASRHLPQYITQLQQGHWQHNGNLGLGRVLAGQTLGLWGYGKIGQMIAQYAKVFGMQVLVWGSETSCALAGEHGFVAAESQAAFFAQSDVISLHLRLNEATRGIVTYSDLARMKPNALFVNTSRAELVAPDALYRAMTECPTRQAAVDVYEQEPCDATTQPLIALSNVLCTPHLGYVERESYELYFKHAFANVIAFAQGQPTNLVAHS